MQVKLLPSIFKSCREMANMSPAKSSKDAQIDTSRKVDPANTMMLLADTLLVGK